MFPTINMHLLPMKGHYLFFFAAIAPILAFLPLMARQVGFSGTTVGVIYTILPIVGMLAKPIFGGIADRFQCKKLLFIVFLIIMTASMFLINFIPSMPADSQVHFSCDNGQTVFDTTPNKRTIDDKCAATRIAVENEDKSFLKCSMSCSMPNPKLYDIVCKHWHALQYCTVSPEMFEFVAHVPMNEIEVIGRAVYFLVPNVTLPDGNTVVPFCPNATYKMSLICDADCDSPTVTNLLSRTRVANKDVIGIYQFWMFFLLTILAWAGLGVVVSISDAICFEMLGNQPNLYGNQRLWGSIGWGVFSIIAGLLVDAYSVGQSRTNYAPVFYSMLIIMVLDILISSRLKYTQQKMSASIIRDIGKLVSSSRMVVFLLWCCFVGICTGVLWQFLFWHLEDLAAKFEGDGNSCNMHRWIKTLEGLVMGIQCLGGELPFFFLSGWILKRVGHVHCMSIVLLNFGIRYVLYSVLVDPWWVLPIELMNGVTFGLFYATMTSYASIVAPPGTEATTQGLVGATFEGIGVSIGSLLGGIIFDKYGGWILFRVFGIASLVCCLLHVLTQKFILKNSDIVKERGDSDEEAD